MNSRRRHTLDEADKPQDSKLGDGRIKPGQPPGAVDDKALFSALRQSAYESIDRARGEGEGEKSPQGAAEENEYDSNTESGVDNGAKKGRARGERKIFRNPSNIKPVEPAPSEPKKSGDEYWTQELDSMVWSTSHLLLVPGWLTIVIISI